MRILIFILGVLFTQFSYAANNEILDRVTVEGRGYVDVEPDIVNVSFDLYAVKQTLPKAKRAVDELYKIALVELEKFDIQKKDIKLTFINSRPEYEWNENKRILIGQRVSRSLEITVRKLDKYPGLLESLVNAGISEINRISASVSDKQEFERLAMKKAVAVAKDKARFLANEFERQLDKVLVISEIGIHAPIPLIRNRAESQQAVLRSVESERKPPSANFGTQRISASVSVIFALK